MTANDIRKKFLDYFAARGHRVVRSSSLVPANDPTLLFTNAGMNQFKDVFLGREKRDYLRACSSQKCVRAGGKHNDLEQVGRTTRHHTFFEMLGNFSFGDYFKKEAIPWAWELVTREYAIPREKLYITVFREDDDAEEIWTKSVGVPRQRIFRRDEKDNFWAMGETGPCGPCSEIHYDLGPAASELGHKDCKFPCPDDCGRYVELWNLVFMQFNRDEQGKLAPLPRPSIDTGAGLERLATVLQGKISNFDTDLFRPLIEQVSELSATPYGEGDSRRDAAMRVVADHVRAMTFLISDGVLPSNEGRGYVLRKIMRRAIDFGRALGLEQPFLYQMTGRVVDLMKQAYPELLESAASVTKVIKAEEERYAHLIVPALERFDAHLAPRRAALSEPGPIWSDPQALFEITGEDLFFAYDTLGLRPDFIRDVTEHRRWKISRDADAAFERELSKQRERARASWRAIERKLALPAYLKLSETLNSAFLGYDNLSDTGCKVEAILARGIDQLLSEAAPGKGPIDLEVVLDKTPFYAQAGGQVGDSGWFVVNGEKIARVEDTYSPVTGVITHRIRWAWPPRDFVLRLGDLVTAEVEEDLRRATMRNHTATHLLHAALRQTLGTHVKQAGSLVAPDRLRFDFTHYAALDEQDLLDIEDLVNEHVLANEPVETQVMDLDAAINSGAMALFGEKYGDKVRVVSITDFSKELCGGTHVCRTGDIGLFKVISEASVAAGTRRVEALTGQGVLEYLRRSAQTLAQLSNALRAKPDELLETVEKLTESEKKLRKQLESQQMKQAASQGGNLLEQAKNVKGVRVVSARVEGLGRGAMRQMVDGLRPKLGSGVIVLGGVSDGSPGQVALVAAVSKDLTHRLDAGKIVKEIATLVGGTGGGRKDLAEAGGKSPEKLDESLQAVPSIIEKML